MQTILSFNFRKKEYLLKVDTSPNLDGTNYFISIFFRTNLIKKGHFLRANDDFTAILSSSNHSFEPTEYDNDLLYALKETLFECFPKSLTT